MRGKKVLSRKIVWLLLAVVCAVLVLSQLAYKHYREEKGFDLHHGSGETIIVSYHNNTENTVLPVEKTAVSGVLASEDKETEASAQVANKKLGGETLAEKCFWLLLASSVILMGTRLTEKREKER